MSLDLVNKIVTARSHLPGVGADKNVGVIEHLVQFLSDPARNGIG